MEVKNLCKAYGDRPVLENVSFTVGVGVTALWGPSGVGKTTLLRILLGLEKPDSGTITICGQKNPGFSSHAAVELRRHHISYLFQNYGLIDTETVEGNMRTATHFKQISRKKERLLIEGALEQVGLRGYEKRKVYTLSGGEQQRVILARALTQQTECLVLDEPTNAIGIMCWRF